MGVVESAMRKNLRVGQDVDVTLIGGRELRGRITAFGEDGILLAEGEQERPVAFLGIATFIATPQADRAAEYKNSEESNKTCSQEEPPESVRPAQGWIDRYEPNAGLGSILYDGQRALFESKDVLDPQLAGQLEKWFGRAIAVRFDLHERGEKRTASGITLRSTQEKYRPGEPKAQDAPQTLGSERYGFGEILHFDKQNGYGKAREGNVKFLFRQQDISSAALWKEIQQSENTCGIKIAFTVRSEEKGDRYTQIREIAALQQPDQVEKPRFEAPEREIAPEEDVNPDARETFTDGTVMEEAVRAGTVMFYNADRFFGRLQQEDGARYYFRANDVMQKSLLDFLVQRPAYEVADTPVTFSVKTLPTGKLAAGRVRWNTPESRKETKKETAPAPAKAEPEPKQAETPQLNPYCTEYLRAWGGPEDQLAERLRQVAALCTDETIKRDVALECVALSDVRREKRDEAMLHYLQAFAQAPDGQDLNGFLGAAQYTGAEMFDALTRLFAASDGAYGRLCGLIAGDGELVALRGEILERLGAMPETAQELKERWRPLVEAERERSKVDALPPSRETLARIDPEGRQADWAAVLDARDALEQGQEPTDVQALLDRVREEILRAPSRLAVEWMLPIVRSVQERLHGAEEDLTVRALCALEVDGRSYVCLEVAGADESLRVRMGEAEAEIGALSGCAQVALPGSAGEQQIELCGRNQEKEWNRKVKLDFAPAKLADATQTDRLAQVLEREGVAVLCGAAQDGGELESDPKDIAVALGKVDSVQDAARRLLSGLKAEMESRYGAEVVGLLSFPNEVKEDAAGREALMAVLRDFADVRLLHDQLKGAHILCTMAAPGKGEAEFALAQEMKPFGVRTVLRVEQKPERAAPAQVLHTGPKDFAQALRAAGFAVERLFLPQQEKKGE